MAHPSRAAWLKEAGWGVFCHYLADQASAQGPVDMTPDAWNRRIDAFDVDRLVHQLQSVGARYFGITIGQNSGYYCSPNATYDSLVERTPSRCSNRDLIGELCAALRQVNIRFMAYLPSGAPEHDEQAVSRLEWRKVTMDRSEQTPSTQERLASFQLKWEAIIREWSTRWGRDVSAWWIDGCYSARAMYRHEAAPNFASLAAALRSGNRDAAIAFNPGVKVPIVTVAESGEDFTAGEIDQALVVDFGRPHDRSTWPDGQLSGVQLHVLLPMGRWWGIEPIRFTPELVRAYTRHIMQAGGAVTWDVPVDERGSLSQTCLDALATIERLRP
jgi:Alpha-L-fucosidase